MQLGIHRPVVCSSGGTPGWGAFVQGKGVDFGSITSGNVAYTNPVAVNGILTCAIRVGATGRTVTVTDNANAGNWTQLVTQQQTTDGHQLYIFCRAKALAGATTVTIAISGAAATVRATIMENSGSANGAILADPTNSNQLTLSNGQTIDTNAVATTRAVELLVSAVTTSNAAVATWSPSTGWTQRAEALAGSNAVVTMFDRNATSTGSYSDTTTLTSASATNSAAAIASIYEGP